MDVIKVTCGNVLVPAAHPNTGFAFKYSEYVRPSVPVTALSGTVAGGS